MTLGQRYTPSLWHYEFSDYAVDYAVEQCPGCYEPLELCPEGIRILMEYDDTHPEDPREAALILLMLTTRRNESFPRSKG